MSALFVSKRGQRLNFRNVPRSVICGEWPVSVAGKVEFCVWFGFILLLGFFFLNSFSVVIYNFYMKSHCNLKLGTWHFDSVTFLTIQNFYEM